jgi:hypothetical protein
LLILLAILIFVYNLGVAFYYARGLEPSPTLEFLYTSAFICGVVWWLRAESRKYSITLVYCPGLLVGFAWAILVPYHLLKTRGVRGLLPLLGLIGSFMAAYLLAILVYVGMGGE